ASGGPPVAVTGGADLDWNPVWSPDGHYLYFSSDHSGSLNLWRAPINERTGEVLGTPEAVTTPSPFVADLTISADGRHIAYASIDGRQHLQQAAFDPLTGRIKGIPTWITSGSRFFDGPSPAPSGDVLVFTCTDKQEDLCVSRADGEQLRALTNDPPRDRYPRWAPDGKRIMFYSDRSGGVWELWSIDSDGSGLRQLTKHPGANNAVWSPDGTRIAFIDINENDVFVFEADKPWEQQELVKLPHPPPSMVRFNPKDWSPDGQKIAGATHTGVVVYSFASQTYQPVAPRLAGWPAWLPDSRRMLVAGDGGKLRVVDTLSGKSTEIFSAAPENIIDVAISNDGKRIWFTRTSNWGDIWMATLK